MDPQRIRRAPSAAQHCLDHLSSRGHWAHDPLISDASLLERNDDLWQWTAPVQGECGLRTPFNSDSARTLLKGQHVVVIGDLAARLWYAALLYLINGTAQPSEVADGFPMHKQRADAPCAWNPDSMRRGGYDFGGWAHFHKSSPCFRRWYGWRFGTLLDKPLTLNHTPGSKAWWGRGTTRDVMTMLLRESLLWGTWLEPTHDVRLTYLWKGVIRTSGSYKAQHARHLAQVAAKAGRPPTIIVAAMGTYDSQWQDAQEVTTRLSGLFRGLADRWPAGEAGAPLLIANGPSSCAAGKKYSVYMGRGTRHGTFRNLDNASALIPGAREAARNHSVLYVDTSPMQMSAPPLRTSPCHYDLPLGVVAESLVQVTLNGLKHAGASPKRL